VLDIVNGLDCALEGLGVITVTKDVALVSACVEVDELKHDVKPIGEVDDVSVGV
jgi:hypothetical protein